MEKVISHKSRKGHYRAEAAIVWCFDFRFSKLFNLFIEEFYFGKPYDLIRIAGGAKDLASPVRIFDTEYVLGQLAKSVKLHDPKKIVLMVHQECGDYGKKFRSDGEEKKFYIEELKKAKNLVLNKYPNKIAETYYADFSGLWRV